MKKYEVKFSERVFEVEAKDEEQAEFLGLQARDNDEMAGGAEISVNEIHKFAPAKMPKFRIGVYEEQSGYVEVEAESAKEAEKKAEEILEESGIAGFEEKHNFDVQHRHFELLDEKGAPL